MDGLKIEVPDLENPYREAIINHLSSSFVANLESRGSVLESVTAGIISTGKIRYGPTPNPESLVSIRNVIRNSMDQGVAIPILVPWGSKKPVNGVSVDIAELWAMKTLQCLQERVVPFYPKGLEIVLAVEDTGGFYLFQEEGPSGKSSINFYTQDMVKLPKILGHHFIWTLPESQLMDLDNYTHVAEVIRPMLVDYINDTDANGFDGAEKLKSYLALQANGWKGLIPKEQRDFYRGQYAKQYGGTSRDHTEMLARYLAGSLARYLLKGRGNPESWGSHYLTLSFVQPVPGIPPTMGERRVYYRTMPEDLTRTHIPPWRAHGYFKIDGNQVAPKLSNWAITEAQDFERGRIRLSRSGMYLDINADYQIIS